MIGLKHVIHGRKHLPNGIDPIDGAMAYCIADAGNPGVDVATGTTNLSFGTGSFYTNAPDIFSLDGGSPQGILFAKAGRYRIEFGFDARATVGRPVSGYVSKEVVGEPSSFPGSIVSYVGAGAKAYGVGNGTGDTTAAVWQPSGTYVIECAAGDLSTPLTLLFDNATGSILGSLGLAGVLVTRLGS